MNEKIIKMYSIYDKKGEAFSSPFFSRTHGEAERMFRNDINKPDSWIGKYAEDYSLFYVGEFSTISGKTIPKDNVPLHLVEAIQLKAQANTPE